MVKDMLKANSENIITLYKSGLLQREIADIYGVSKTSISKFLRNAGITSKVVISIDGEISICKLYESGKTQVEVAKIFGVGVERVVNVLKKYNVHIRQGCEFNKKYTLDEYYFDNIDSQDKAYLLGLLFADGNRYGNQIKILLQERDKNILEKMNEILGSNRPLRFLNYNEKNSNWQNQYELCIVNKYMANRLNELGLFENKSLSLIFPEYLTPNLYRHFIRGYFDGDGYVSKNKKEARVSIISTEQMCTNMADIVKNELKIYVEIALCHGRTDVTTRTLRISGKKQIIKFLDYIYDDANLFLERKYNIYKTIWKNNNNINNSLST